MKFGIIVFPGSHGEDDLVHVLRHVMQREAVKIWHKDTDLGGIEPGDCLLLPGGFSFGDYLRPGAIARLSPVMKAVVEFAMKGGLVWGIANGFQVLCEAGLLPGLLLQNEKGRFICKNLFVKAMTSHSALTSNILNKELPLKLPVASSFSRYHVDEATLLQLEENDQILFKYCSEDGQIDEASNPFGSLANIAGICNAQRNVFGLMPQPERASEQELGNMDGKILFESLIHTTTNLIEN